MAIPRKRLIGLPLAAIWIITIIVPLFNFKSTVIGVLNLASGLGLIVWVIVLSLQDMRDFERDLATRYERIWGKGPACPDAPAAIPPSEPCDGPR